MMMLTFIVAPAEGEERMQRLLGKFMLALDSE
jgi:hypothetical protein